ncbi:MAG: Nif3-like dinuclear metal center hexameric protein [Ardenticatenaceae bacterium]|nr:Nif3-like dinuclear metal center hexameric protein [Ardenticatenaceae bacterium]
MKNSFTDKGVPVTQLADYLDGYLRVAEIADYGPQGLQVEADKAVVGRIALAVDVAPDIIEAAVEWRADMLLVHHGIFWGGPERIAGPLGKRVRWLLKNDIHLYAAHLPLDAHQTVGNNAVLADLLELENRSWWAEIKGTPLAVIGTRAPIAVEEVVNRLNTNLQTSARLLGFGPQLAQRIAILSGAGADKVGEAKALGADTYITGETSHAHFWQAADYGINVIFGGHYATETVGVQALGRHLTSEFGVECRFFDYPTGM